MRCNNIKTLSSFDLNNSFWQILLNKMSRKHTSFLCQGRCLQFTWLPFETKNSEAALIRGLRQLFNGELRLTLQFIDAFLCVIQNFDQHMDHLRLFFKYAKKEKLF